MSISALVLAAVLAQPFEDTAHRFHLDLPPQWQFAPQPGDTHGAVFRRMSDNVFVNAMVRVMELPVGTSLDAFATRVRAASEDEPGYRSLMQRPCKVAGVPAQCRRFVTFINGDEKMPKMSEQRILLSGHFGFVVHAETLADGFALFEPDILALMASFGTGAAPLHAAPPPPQVRPADMLGIWRSTDGQHRLVLSPGGVIQLDKLHGTYQLSYGSLIATLDDGAAIFEFSLAKGVLTLSGGMFGEGQAFVRTPKKTRK